MSFLNKTCRKHGVLQPEDILKESVTKERGYKVDYILRCRKCKNERIWKEGAKCKKHGLLNPEDTKTNGRCSICHRATAATKRNNNRAWFNAKMAEDRLKNPEKWEIIRKREYQNSIKNHGHEVRNTKEILRMHGLTQEQYDQMFKEQNHKCKICNMPETRAGRTPGTIARLTVDHCHSTGNVRGLLCHKCNCLLGYARDSLDILHLAIMYLEESGKRIDDY